MIEVNMPNQEAKKDAGKPEIDLVPMNIVEDIAWIRMYGNRKYPGDPNNWKNVEPRRYHNALARHLIEYLKDPYGNDEESGLPHLWHLATNAAFLCELEDSNMRPTNDIYPYAKKTVDTKKELKVEPEDDFVFIDFEPEKIPFEGADKPKYTGKYEFSFYGKDDWTEGYYILDYDIVVDEKGLKMHPNYWRHM